jgi:hypothetical protein
MHSPTCRYYGRRGHLDRDYWSRGPQKKCFNCGDPNHLNYVCPKLWKIEQGLLAPPIGKNRGPTPGLAGNGGQKPQVQARVFALNREEFSIDVVVAEGMLPNYG